MLDCTLEGIQLRHCTAKPIVQVDIIANASGFSHQVCFDPETNEYELDATGALADKKIC